MGQLRRPSRPDGLGDRAEDPGGRRLNPQTDRGKPMRAPPNFVLPLAVVTSLAAAVSPALAQSQARTGEQIFDHWCAACHSAGQGRPGTAALQYKYGGEKPGELEKRTDLTPEVVKFFVRNGVSVMPYFRKTEITDAELDRLADYLAKAK
jgi:mono/diheme cytochrome c family protein